MRDDVAGLDEMKKDISDMPPKVRESLLRRLGKYCPKCGRVGKKEARGFGITSLSCVGGPTKDTRHPHREWEAEL